MSSADGARIGKPPLGPDGVGKPPLGSDGVGKPPLDPSRRDLAALAGLAVLALTSRLPFLIHYDEDIDALRFALAVERFDVATLRPHAPFYPVYVAAAKVVAAMGASPQVALGWIGAVAGAVLVVATAWLARELSGRRAAVVAGVLALANPFAWLTSVKLLSDMSGAAFVTVALALLARSRRLADGDAAERRAIALFVLGVGLGARLSYFPFALVAAPLAAMACGGIRGWLRAARDLGSGVMLWLLPLVWIGGAAPLVRTMWIQGTGHFTRWGGSVITVASPVERVAGIAWGAFANLLGGPWSDAGGAMRWVAGAAVVVLAVAAATCGRAPWRGQREVVAGTIAYAIWAALGQNSAHKPRHLLPLLPVVIVALAQGAEQLARRWRGAWAVATALAAAWAVVGARLVSAHREPSPAAALVGDLARRGRDSALVVTRDLGRMIEVGAPEQRWVRLDEADPAGQLAARAAEGRVRITGEAVDASLRPALAARGLALERVFGRPRSRYIDPLWSELTLFEVAHRPLP